MIYEKAAKTRGAIIKQTFINCKPLEQEQILDRVVIQDSLDENVVREEILKIIQQEAESI